MIGGTINKRTTHQHHISHHTHKAEAIHNLNSPLIINARRCIKRARKIRQVHSIPRRIALIRQPLTLANLILIRRHGLFLDILGGLDEGGEETGDEMPVDVAVYGPDACQECQRG